MLRTVKYLSLLVVQFIGALLGVGALFIAFYAVSTPLSEFESAGWRILGMAFACGMMFPFVLQASLIQSYMPLPLSMGVTRRGFFAGAQAAKVMLAGGIGVCLLLIQLAVKWMFGVDALFTGTMLVGLFAVLLLGASVGEALAVLGGAWLLGEALSLCIMYFAHEEEYFSLGTVFAAIMLVMFGVIFALYYFSCGYEQALTMSCTRRRFLFGMFVTVCLQLLCLVGGIVVLTLLDRGLYLLLFRGMPIDGPDLLQPEALRWAWVILPAVLVLACTGLFLGACIQRWGRRALWLLWAAYMAVFLFGDTFTRLAEGAGRDTLLGRALGAVVDVLAFIPGGPARVLLALALLTAATVSGAALLLRGSVRQTA